MIFVGPRQTKSFNKLYSQRFRLNKHPPGHHYQEPKPATLRVYISAGPCCVYCFALWKDSSRTWPNYFFPVSDPEVLLLAHCAGMDDSSSFERKGVFRFMDLIAELRRMIYRIAVVEPHPLPLIPHRYRMLNNNFVDAYAVEKDLRMLETSREFRTEMKEMLYSENSFSYFIGPNVTERGIEANKIDLKRIKKFYLHIEDLGPAYPIWEFDDYDDLGELIRNLSFRGHGHQVKYLLVECKRQSDRPLAEYLSPLADLRGIPSFLLRSCQPEMHRYFRFLEYVMMSDRPVPFRAPGGRRNAMDVSLDLERYSEATALARAGMTGNRVVKSEEQMEATAKKLYSILKIEGGFIPQSELG